MKKLDSRFRGNDGTDFADNKTDKFKMKKIAIITSEFNREITGKLHAGAIERLKELNYTDITEFWVPGAIEIPLIAKLCAKSQKYAAIICLGAVVRGETTHYDYVCQQVSQGCQQVMMEFELPVIFGVLTTENEAQAFDRVGGAHGHKGHDAAEAAVRMIKLVASIGA